MDELLPLDDEDFRFISSFLYERFGIRLTEQKRTLIAGRLTKRVRALGHSSFREYFASLRSDRAGAELSELMNLITTNHSFFFRERDHFDFLFKVALPRVKALIEKDRRYPLRIWSAGCAAGEEVYTIAMVVREFFGDEVDSLDLGIIATDISMAVLREAQAGIYGEGRLRELPKGYLSKYILPAGADQFAVAPDIRRMVLFKRLNLMTEKFPFKKPFDVVFCRNVMIYFDVDSRKRLVRSLFEVVKPGGHFFIGHSESLPRDSCPFEYLRPATYRKAALP